MDVKDFKRLFTALDDAEVYEFTYDTPELKFVVKRGKVVEQHIINQPVPVAAAPAAAMPAAPAPEAPAAEPAAAPQPAAASGVEVTAPIVGTFYEAPAPDADPFVKVGDTVEVGQVLCIIEAMKLMNEIEAETNGVITEVLINNGEPVEYGQALFRIEPA